MILSSAPGIQLSRDIRCSSGNINHPTSKVATKHRCRSKTICVKNTLDEFHAPISVYLNAKLHQIKNSIVSVRPKNSGFWGHSQPMQKVSHAHC